MPTVRRFTTQDAPAKVLLEIRAVLDDAFGGEFAEEDWRHALGGWHVVVTDDDMVVAHASVVPRALAIADTPFRTGYVEAVGTAPGHRGEGLASIAMHEIAELMRSEFEMGALSTGRHDFYERLGWERWHGPTFVRNGSELIRTEEEDDGVMVLRFGPSDAVDLTAPITCDARTGDDW